MIGFSGYRTSLLSNMLCENKLTGRHGTCGSVMKESMDMLGRIFWSCERCEAQAQGRCRSCGKARESKHKQAMYCNVCRKDKDKKSRSAHNAQPSAKLKSKLRSKRRSSDPVRAARMSELRKQWMEKHPHKRAEYKRNLILKELGRKK